MTKLLFAFLLLTLTSCSALRVTEKADTPSKQLAVAQITLDGLRTAHTNLLSSGTINSRSLDVQLTEQEDSVERLIVVARTAFNSGDLTTAKGQLKILDQAMLLLTTRIAELQATEQARKDKAKREGEGK